MFYVHLQSIKRSCTNLSQTAPQTALPSLDWSTQVHTQNSNFVSPNVPVTSTYGSGTLGVSYKAQNLHSTNSLCPT